jgi:hypothetical protein
LRLADEGSANQLLAEKGVAREAVETATMSVTQIATADNFEGTVAGTFGFGAFAQEWQT